MKRIPFLSVVAVALGMLVMVGLHQPAQAEGALKKRFWTERKAEKRVKRHFADVRSADCLGLGYNWRYDGKGREVFTAFYCSGELTDGTEYQITVYTTGKKRFKWYPY